MGLFGGNKTISSESQRIGAIKINSSAYGLAIPLVWGTTRINGNIIWYGDFTAVPHTDSQKTGGKGGGGTTMKSTTYTYTCAFALGLCEGQINAIGQVWSGKDKTSISALGISTFNGSMPQSPWSYLTSIHPTEAVSYPGLAYVATGALDLGESANIPNLSFEVAGARTIGTLNAVTVNDARPDEIVTDLLTGPLYGAGVNLAQIGDLTAYRTYCQAMGFFLSPAITEQAQASEHLKSLCQMTNTELVWSEGVLKFIPYGDQPVTGYGVTYTPDTAPQYYLTDDDFISLGDDPIIVRRKTTADAYNHVQIEISDRASEYNPAIIEAKDQSNIEQFGLRTMEPIKMHWVCDRTVANNLAPLILQRQLYIRNEYEFKLGWRYCRLEPMDIVMISHAPLGLNSAVVRIVSVEESEEGDLTVIAEEMPWAVATPAKVKTASSSGATVDFNVAPGNANTPTIFEPPISLAGQSEIWMASSGGGTWGGAEVWISLDGSTYKQVGQITAPARHGVLTAAFNSGSDPDVVNTLSVDLSVSHGTLTTATQQDRDLFNTICWVDGEIVSYQTAVLTGSNRYNLTSLRRGGYGTANALHAINAKFVRLDNAIFKYAYDKTLVGKTIYVKLRSYNIYGGAPQDLSTVTPTTYAIAGAPVGAVGGLSAEQSFTGKSAKIAWLSMDGATGYQVEVWANSVKRRTAHTTDTRYEYTFEDAKADGGPWRTLQFKVYAVTETGVSSTPALLQLTNPQVGAPSAVAITGILEGLTISCATPADTDYAGCRVWVSATTGFDPNVMAPVYDGTNSTFTNYGLTGNATYYVRIGCYDVFGTDGMTLSTELSVLTHGSNTDPTTMLSQINTLLTDGSGTAKIELLADRFAIKSPSGDKTPFAVVDTGGGAYKTLLNSDVLIGGNVSIANLSAGSLPTDVVMSLGGGVVQLDGAGEIRAYAASGANQDFVRLNAAQIQFMRYITGTGYVTYNFLSRIEAGTANNGDVVAIPGYWKTQPKVMVSPSSLQLYKTSFANQDQGITCSAATLAENPVGSGKWQFTATATLNLSAATGSTAVNETSGTVSAANWTSATKTTAANDVSVTPTVSFLSVRGNGTSQYFYRSVRWRVEHWSGSAWVQGSFRVVNMGAQTTTTVQDSVLYTFPSSGTWQWRIYAESYDTDGTVFGAGSYTFAQDTATMQTGTSVFAGWTNAQQWGVNSATSSKTGTVPFNAYTLPVGWEIYQKTYSWSQGYTFFISSSGDSFQNPVYSVAGIRVDPAATSGISFVGQSTSDPNKLVAFSKSYTVSGSNLSASLTDLAYSISAVSMTSGATFTGLFNNGTVTIYRRQPIPNSTTASNTYNVVSYGWALSSAQTLATGTLNWLAIGQ